MADIISSTTSTSVTIDSKSVDDIVEFKFVLDNGKAGITTVSDELLDTEERAEARALSEFLQNSYKKKQVSFTTYRTDFVINDIVLVEGLRYIIKNIEVDMDEKSMYSKITAIRYED